MRDIMDSSIDAIITDPPFLYLKNNEIDIPFDEELFFKEAFRVLKPDGLLAVFGRGLSFYRWGCLLAGMGMKFKEEIIWDKGRVCSPLNAIGRRHETISVWTKRNGIIRRSYIPYKEETSRDLNMVIGDIKRLSAALGNPKELEELKEYISSKQLAYRDKRKETKFSTTVKSQSINDFSRCVGVMQSMTRGRLESDIIHVTKNSYKAIHPTEKPLNLMRRLIYLLSDSGGIILGPFAGSAITLIAAKLSDRHYMGFEINKRIYEIANERLCSYSNSIFLTE